VSKEIVEINKDIEIKKEEKSWFELIVDNLKENLEVNINIKKDKNTDDIDVSFSTNYKNSKK
jgi:hypothetical protein